MPWRRKGQPSPVFLPGRSHGQRSLACYCYGVAKESDTTWPPSNNTHTIVGSKYALSPHTKLTDRNRSPVQDGGSFEGGVKMAEE